MLTKTEGETEGRAGQQGPGESNQDRADNVDGKGQDTS